LANGRLSRCTVAREIPFGEARIPAGSYIALNPDGTPNLVQMSHDAPVLGLTCMGQGVPCMSGGFFGDGRGGGAQFHENGKLKSCKLTKDYGSWHKGDRFVQAP
jgi:hypothetical protein